MSLISVMPDWEACMLHYVLSDDEFAENWDDRLYRNWPKGTKTFPLAVFQLIGDPPISDGAHGPVLALFQFDVYGGSAHEAWVMTDTIRRRMAAITGTHTTPAGDFTAGFVRNGGARPSRQAFATQGVENGAEVSRRRPDYSFDSQVTLRPARSAGS